MGSDWSHRPAGLRIAGLNTVRRLQDELGFITNLTPSGAETDSVSSEFLELLAERRSGTVRPVWHTGAGPFWPGTARSKMATAVDVPTLLRGPEWQFQVDPSLVPGADPRLAYIYASGKMTPRLESALIDAGLGVPVRAHGLVGMHPQLAFVYMHALASKMAASVMCPLTDNDFDHAAAGCTAGRIATALLDLQTGQMAPGGNRKDPVLEFAVLALQLVIPRDINSLPVQKIIEIRQRHFEELGAFQQATQTIIDAVPEAAASMNPEVAAMFFAGSLREDL